LGIGADWGLKNLETAVAFTEGTLTAEAAVQAEADTEREATNQIRLLLGDEGFAKLPGMPEGVSRRGRWCSSLTSSWDLSRSAPFSERRWRASSKPNRRKWPRGLAGDFTVRELVSPDGLDGRFQAQAESNQRILQAAAGFLSPEQVESLRLMQVVQYERAKANCAADVAKAVNGTYEIIEQDAVWFVGGGHAARRLGMLAAGAPGSRIGRVEAQVRAGEQEAESRRSALAAAEQRNREVVEAEGRAGNERLLALMRERAAAAKSASEAAAKTHTFGNALASVLDSPDQQQVEKNYVRDQMRANLDLFFKLTKLPPEKIEQYTSTWSLTTNNAMPTAWRRSCAVRCRWRKH
jgi:hypothetical protein